MRFTKYQGLGNDFLIVDEELDEKTIIFLCDRHFGVGADGVIIQEFKDNVPFMKFFNQDGSRAKMCGNGIRCYADYLYHKNLDYTTIDTLAGLKKVEKVGSEYKVFMGKAENLEIKDGYYNIFTGTNHLVIISNKGIEYLKEIGPKLQKKYDTNVNLVNILDRENIDIYTYERGVGITLACGTGACASAYVANKLNLVDKNVNVHLLGGDLKIFLTDEGIYMQGSAKKVFEGEIK
ncbi:diaminopimelate epimerase [Sneathia vaginalis]|uniref:diaminopimelate epimerase n=1 Tax=Sneathia TaxID=168808 RepID=UPI0018665DC5|nr:MULTISPECIES: diaminopimelate epimerase [Sneathia]MBE2989457.1 diaminopimelate epimerase [Sneathia sp. DSM 16630]MBE3031357.1 diaminopimelate epimerase [Sneathia sp. DSM 16631]MDK9582443.1 diaminopimelate epimerase [Sneathia vaginalis]